MRRLLNYFAIGLLSISVIIVAVVIGIMAWSFFSLKISLTLKTDPAAYPGIIARRDQIPAYAFLPKQIDPSAEKIAFYHQPGFLQGGDVICLRIKLSPTAAKQYLHALKSSERLTCPVQELPFQPSAYPPFDAKPSSRDEFFDQIKELPPNFEVFLFATNLETLKKDSNHGFLAFTAVSLATSEVVYYADEW